MTADVPAAPTPDVLRSLWQGRFRLPSFALMLGITLVAFEAMAVATVMPVVVDDLGGLRLYPWAFTAFFLADVVGIAVAGDRCDRDGPVPSLVGGLLVFAVGLLVGGAAPDMAVFVAGRALQGLGAGAVIVAIYVLVADVYPDVLRPKVFAVMSAAWVVPALVGPVVAGVVAEHLHWRFVFGGLVPAVAVGALLLLRASAGVTHRRDASRAAPRGRVVVALGAAAGLGLVQAAGDHVRWLSLPLAAVGVALLAPTLRRLLPHGTLRMHTGLPAAVAMRGLLAATFFGAEAFLPYALVRLHGYAPAAAGLPLTAGAVGWSVGSWVQGHWPVRRPRWMLAAVGLSLVAAGVGSLALLAVDPVPGWVAIPVWTVAGAGMGLSMPVLSVLVLELSPAGEQGVSAAALQICDVLGSIVGVGLGGALFAAVQRAGGGASPGIAAIDVVLGAVALGAVPLARRLRRPGPGPGAARGARADAVVRG